MRVESTFFIPKGLVHDTLLSKKVSLSFQNDWTIRHSKTKCCKVSTSVLHR